jgi:DNA polymerase elongation subunit (family B)
MVNLRDLVLAK